MHKNLKKKPGSTVEVLVTDGNTRAALAVSRSLARQGISFLVLTDTPNCYAYHSRSVKYLIYTPPPDSEPRAFIAAVLELIKKHKIQLVLPISDRTLSLFDSFRKSLSEYTRLALPSSESIQYVLDKRKNRELAKKLGIPCPRQFELKDLSEIPRMIEKLGWPIVMKNPGLSPDQQVSPFKFRYLFAHDEKELRSLINKHCQGRVYPLFQECASGRVYHMCCFATYGEVIAMHHYLSIRRLRGEGVLRKVLPPIPEIEKYASRILKALRWDGIAHIEFFINNDKKKKWYIETNGRFWASTQGSIHAGWDFPLWVYNYFRHDKVPKPGNIKIGSQICWRCGDLNALIDYWRGGDSPATGTNPGKLKATFLYLSDFSPKIHSDVFRWNDPKPALIEHWLYFKRFFPSLPPRF